MAFFSRKIVSPYITAKIIKGITVLIIFSSFSFLRKSLLIEVGYASRYCQCYGVIDYHILPVRNRCWDCYKSRRTRDLAKSYE